MPPDSTSRNACASPRRPRLSRRHTIGLKAGIAAFIILLLIPAPAGIPPEAWRVTAIVALMGIFWVTEALPVAATALLPVVLLPLTGVMPVGVATEAYANPLVFLMFGGFVIALGVQQSGLHRRLALWLLGQAGTAPARLVAGFMGATAFLSMWISNTATAALMLPIALSVLALLGIETRDSGRGETGEARAGESSPQDGGSSSERAPAMAIAMLLAIAFGANIGGMATLIGTPPNALLAGYAGDRFGLDIGFAAWMMAGLPVALILLGLAWLILTRLAFPVGSGAVDGADALLARETHALGPPGSAEKRVAIVFAAAVSLWLTRPLIQSIIPAAEFLSDPVIAIGAACLLFTLPSGRGDGRALVPWEATGRLPWGVLILIGGGLSLGGAIEASGLSSSIADALAGLAAFGIAALLVGLAAAVMLLSHFMSNTATAAIFMPVAASVAIAEGVAPLAVMGVVALSASAAFMMPVATPPNAIVYASGLVRVADMVRGGLLVSVAALATVTLLGYALLLAVFGAMA